MLGTADVSYNYTPHYPLPHASGPPVDHHLYGSSCWVKSNQSQGHDPQPPPLNPQDHVYPIFQLGTLSPPLEKGPTDFKVNSVGISNILPRYPDATNPSSLDVDTLLFRLTRVRVPE